MQIYEKIKKIMKTYKICNKPYVLSKSVLRESRHMMRGGVKEGSGRMLALTISIGFDENFEDILLNLCRRGRKA